MFSKDGYVCLDCGRKFNDKGNANRHYRTQHLPVAPAQCHVCHKIFKHPGQRNYHRAKFHGITERMMKDSINNSTVPTAMANTEYDYQ